MHEKNSFRILLGLAVALLLYFGVGGLVLAQTATPQLDQSASGSGLSRVDQLNGVDVGQGTGAPETVPLPDVPKVAACTETPWTWLPLVVLAGGNMALAYFWLIQKKAVSLGWVIGTGLLSYFIYSAVGCGCGEAGWCAGTPVFVALITALHAGWLWGMSTKE